MFFGQKVTATEPNWLASKKYQNFPYGISTSVQSGTVFKDAAGNVQGLVFNDKDIPEGTNAEVAIMVQGFVIESRLPAVLTATDKKALQALGINFR